MQQGFRSSTRQWQRRLATAAAACPRSATSVAFPLCQPAPRRAASPLPLGGDPPRDVPRQLCTRTPAPANQCAMLDWHRNHPPTTQAPSLTAASLTARGTAARSAEQGVLPAPLPPAPVPPACLPAPLGACCFRARAQGRAGALSSLQRRCRTSLAGRPQPLARPRDRPLPPPTPGNHPNPPPPPLPCSPLCSTLAWARVSLASQ